MKFKAKISSIINNISQVYICSTNNPKSEYDDAEFLSLTIQNGELVGTANNGYVAVSKTMLSAGAADFEAITDGFLRVKSVDLMTTLKSYHIDEVVYVSFDGKDITISPVIVDEDQIQTVQATSAQVAMPDIQKSFDAEFVISRTVLTDAVNSISHAIGDQRYKPHLRFWKMIVENNSLSLLAGCGARYEIYERQGVGFLTSPQKTNFYLSRDHSATIMKILSLSTDDVITIKDKKIKKSEYAEQVLFSGQNLTIIAIGYDPGTTWPDVYKLATRTSPIRFLTSPEDWKYPTGGVEATNNVDARNMQVFNIVSLNFDTKKVVASAKHTMSAKRTVKLKDGNGKVDFRCDAGFVADLFAKAETPQNIQIEFVDGTSPMVCKFHAGDKISDGPFLKVNNAVEERRIVMIAALASKSN